MADAPGRFPPAHEVLGGLPIRQFKTRRHADRGGDEDGEDVKAGEPKRQMALKTTASTTKPMKGAVNTRDAGDAVSVRFRAQRAFYRMSG